MQTATFNVPSISCSACASKIQQGLNELEGVEKVSVDLKTQQVIVDFNPAGVKPEDISKKIASMGFDVIQ